MFAEFVNTYDYELTFLLPLILVITGVLLNFIFMIYDLIKLDKKIKHKAGFFRLIVTLFLPTMGIAMFLGFGLGDIFIFSKLDYRSTNIYVYIYICFILVYPSNVYF